MKYLCLLTLPLLFSVGGFGQDPLSINFPINFEEGSVVDDNFGDVGQGFGGANGFGGGAATVVGNPSIDCINSSSTVGQIIRYAPLDFAGAFVDLTTPFDFGANPSITMKVYTEAPVPSTVTLKIERGGPDIFITQNTITQGAWHTLTFTLTGTPTNYDRLTLLFNLGQIGNGTSASTFYFDDIEHPSLMSIDETTLPVSFEGGTIGEDNFGPIGNGFSGANGFFGGAASVVLNPDQSGINTSATVGQITRNGGCLNAGAYIDLPVNLNFDAYPIICFDVYTEAPAGTEVTLRLEDTDTGVPDLNAVAVTTLSEEWEPLCFVYQLAPDAYDRISFLFDDGNAGDGSATSSFLFDEVEQLITPPDFFYTIGSTYFCPGFPVTFTFPGTGDYQWYSDPALTNQVGTGNTYTSPPLFSNTSYYVQDVTSVPLPITDVGPTSLGPAFDIPSPRTATVDFTSNIDNGLWHSVNIVGQIISAIGQCTYTITGHNLTADSSQTRVRTLNMPNPDGVNLKYLYTFASPVPMGIGDNMQLQVSVSGNSGCRLRSFQIGPALPTIPSYPSTTVGGELTFTGYDLAGSPGAQDQRWMGFDYRISGDLPADPTIYQVNAIADCANPLPIELLDFTVKEDKGDALLHWSTASELNNDRFVLMRTTDGIHFELIGTVSGAGNSSTVLHYSFRDRNPLKGLSYYMLKQVDFDGKESDSELVAFTNDGTSRFQLFPNPTSENLTLTLNEGFDNIEVRVYDLTGRLINQHEFGASDNLSFELTGNPGTYFVEVLVDEQRRETFNVMKL